MINQGTSQSNNFQDHQGSGDNVGRDKIVNNYYAVQINSVNTESIEAIALWKEKLAYLQREEVIASDPAQKFQLKKQIQECQQKIQQLGG